MFASASVRANHSSAKRESELKAFEASGSKLEAQSSEVVVAGRSMSREKEREEAFVSLPMIDWVRARAKARAASYFKRRA